mgnify:CR=1 FL=1
MSAFTLPPHQLRLLCAAFCLLITIAGCALDPVNKSWFGGVAIKGYDPVAYFTDRKPAKGQKKFSMKWQGATWLFASEEHLKLFKAKPEAYAPRYGGYCAWAVSQGNTAGIDPNAWDIVDGKLYLNYNLKVQQKWQADQQNLIQQADKLWPDLVSGD